MISATWEALWSFLSCEIHFNEQSQPEQPCASPPPPRGVYVQAHFCLPQPPSSCVCASPSPGHPLGAAAWPPDLSPLLSPRGGSAGSLRAPGTALAAVSSVRVSPCMSLVRAG